MSSRYYSVVMVKDITGEVTFEVIPSRSVDDRIKELLNDYKRAYARYKAASRKGIQAQKPLKPVLKVLHRRVRGKDKADALMAKYQKLYEEKKAKAAPKKQDNETDPTR